MRNILLYLFLTVSVSVHAQRLPSFGVNKVRIAGPAGTIVTEISAEPEIRLQTDRTYYWYSANAIHTTQGGFSGKLLHGTYQEYYTDKSLKVQGVFEKGLRVGQWKSWQENGALSDVVTWDNGIKNGDFQLYDEQGSVKQAGRFKKGLLDGKVLVYHGKDSIETIRYKAGQVVANKISTPTIWQKIKRIKWRHQALTDGNSEKSRKKKQKAPAAGTGLN